MENRVEMNAQLLGWSRGRDKRQGRKRGID